MMRSDYVHEIFEKQSEIALSNLNKLYQIVGETIEAVFICGTDFGTQDSTFCSPDAFDELWKPYYLSNLLHFLSFQTSLLIKAIARY